MLVLQNVTNLKNADYQSNQKSQVDQQSYHHQGQEMNHGQFLENPVMLVAVENGYRQEKITCY